MYHSEPSRASRTSSIRPRERPGRPTPSSIGAAKAPEDLVGSEGVQERRDRQACCQPERFDLATSAALLFRGFGVRSDDVGVECCLVALAGEADALAADAGVAEGDVPGVDERCIVSPCWAFSITSRSPGRRSAGGGWGHRRSTRCLVICAGSSGRSCLRLLL